MLKNIYYINLESRKDRKENVEKELEKMGFTNYKRFNAIKMDNPRVGCSMSHLKILEEARELNLEEVVIVEDDIMFQNPFLFKKMLEDFLSENINFDVLLLAGNITMPLTKVNDYLYKCKNVYTTTGYIVKKHYYDTLINNIREGIDKMILYPNKSDFCIDVYWGILQEKDKWYIFRPRTVTQRSDFSDIEGKNVDYGHCMVDGLGMRKNICFFVSNFTERGTEIAIYDYAHYNEEVLRNKSYIICFSDNLKKRINYGTWVINGMDTYEKFNKRFKIIEIDDINDMVGLITKYKFDFFYYLTHGEYLEPYFQLDNKDIWGSCKTIKHCIFSPNGIEGDFILSISDYINHKYSINVPVIPHIVNIPNYEGDLREELGIPKNAIVLGRYGGISEFNIGYTKEAIIEFINGNIDENIYFLFMNTYSFIEHHRVKYLPRSVDLRYKVLFINTCDAMIHGRDMGETFGLSVAEFSSKNKPVITAISGDLEHCKILGEKGIFYSNKEELLDIFVRIRDIIVSRDDWNAYRYYNPENVMSLFERLVFRY